MGMSILTRLLRFAAKKAGFEELLDWALEAGLGIDQLKEAYEQVKKILSEETIAGKIHAAAVAATYLKPLIPSNMVDDLLDALAALTGGDDMRQFIEQVEEAFKQSPDAPPVFGDAAPAPAVTSAVEMLRAEQEA